MPAARRLFVHAGLPKTGTSYLQSVCWASTDALAAQGVALLPRRRQDHLNLALQVRDIIGSFDDASHVGGTLDRLARQLATTAASTVLITQEALAPTTTEQARRLLEVLDGWEVHVVVTARDLTRQVPSAWQQRVQARLTEPIEDFYAAVEQRGPLASDFWANHDLARVLASWSAAVGPERTHLVTCPPPGADPAVLLGRFCAVLGVDPGPLSTDAPTDNPALGQAQAELQRRVNLALGDRFPHSRAGYLRLGQAYLAGRVLRRQHGRRAMLPESLRPWAEQTYAGWVAAVDAGGYDVVGDLLDLRPLGTAFEPTLHVVDDTEVADVAARALADVLELRDAELDERAAEQVELTRLRRRVEELEHASQPVPWTVGRVARGVRSRVRDRLR